MEVKGKHWVILIVLGVIAVSGYMWFTKTAPERKYKWEIIQLKLIQEHEALEIQIANQRKELAALKAEAEKSRPQYELKAMPQEEE